MTFGGSFYTDFTKPLPFPAGAAAKQYIIIENGIGRGIVPRGFYKT
ncbi:hypothetical protein SUBVAR_07324 [Subdoligranulum variabile DSM 15176]|uniref:Uncharacterized protein n=1 Tax=Subdoligranulum variabile DSM 15176 TaxID=411471 RepID=D1PSE0_9FIRM|nr:hypothetical protein SUBVAR_07324 [Subdoligranulum variabile DSM 15176]